MSSADDPDTPSVTVDSRALERWPTYKLDYSVETVGCDGAQCTIYPPDVPEDCRLTAWITATDDGFVGLDEVR